MEKGERREARGERHDEMGQGIRGKRGDQAKLRGRADLLRGTIAIPHPSYSVPLSYKQLLYDRGYNYSEEAKAGHCVSVQTVVSVSEDDSTI